VTHKQMGNINFFIMETLAAEPGRNILVTLTPFLGTLV